MKVSEIILAALIILMLFALTSCVPAPPPGPRSMAEPPTPEGALQKDSAAYAQQFGMSQDEAISQLSLQDEIGELNATLQRQEADTFVGLWIQHEPEYRVVVAFTRDGEQTLRPYLKDKPWADQVELRTAPHSLAELEAAQQQVTQVAEGLSISVASSISVTDNRLIVLVGNPELFREDVRAAGQELPQLAEVMAMDPDHLTDTLRGQVDIYPGAEGETIFFPIQPPTHRYLLALMEGTLILDPHGCLRVSVNESSAPLVLWRYGFTLRVRGDTIEVIDDKAHLVGRVGEATRMGGGVVPAATGDGLPIAACPGPYWALGGIEPLAEQAIPDIFVQPLQIQNAAGSTPAADGFFLQQSQPAPEEASLSGRLSAYPDGCLRVDGYAILRPPGVWPREEPGPLRFVLVEDGNETTVAVVGKDVSLSGARREPDDYRFFENKVPCSGPYWGVASFKERLPSRYFSAGKIGMSHGPGIQIVTPLSFTRYRPESRSN